MPAIKNNYIVSKARHQFRSPKQIFYPHKLIRVIHNMGLTGTDGEWLMRNEN